LIIADAESTSASPDQSRPTSPMIVAVPRVRSAAAKAFSNVSAA
jgi:hypothetical protein